MNLAEAKETIRRIEKRRKMKWSGVRFEELRDDQVITLALSMSASGNGKKSKRRKAA